MTTSRRLLLAQAAALAGAALSPAAWTPALAQARLAEDPFGLGVASGEPEPDGVVLWTRLAPRPLEPGFGMASAPVEVSWEIAEDEGLRQVVARGRRTAVAEAGHSVHVTIRGLRPDREYWYRFTAGGHASPVGRTRTAPRAGAEVERLRLAFGSCQKYDVGLYAAHADLAAWRPDLVLFLGDYIYEGRVDQLALASRRHALPVATTLADYRARYALYKSDPDLRAAHAAAPWMVIWDDHEVANNHGGDQDQANSPPAEFLKRRAAAYQAFYENMPLRRRSRPVGPHMQLYRSLAWGRLAELQLVDTRQYRNRRACDAQADGARIPADCPERLEDERSILGARQERWLQDRFRRTEGRWNLLAQPYLMGDLALTEDKVNADGWDGYAASRRRLMEGWREARVSNPVVLGGDIHCFFAGEMALREGGPPIATEFVGGSISSLGTTPDRVAKLVALNPRLKFGDSMLRGYGQVELTRKACAVTFRSGNARQAGAPVSDLARFMVEDGQAGVKRV